MGLPGGPPGASGEALGRGGRLLLALSGPVEGEGEVFPGLALSGRILPLGPRGSPSRPSPSGSPGRPWSFPGWGGWSFRGATPSFWTSPSATGGWRGGFGPRGTWKEGRWPSPPPSAPCGARGPGGRSPWRGRGTSRPSAPGPLRERRTSSPSPTGARPPSPGRASSWSSLERGQPCALRERRRASPSPGVRGGPRPQPLRPGVRPRPLRASRKALGGLGPRGGFGWRPLTARRSWRGRPSYGPASS